MGDTWKECKLGDFLEIKHGFAFKGEYFTDSGDFVLLTPGNFSEEGGLKLKGEKEKYYSGDFPNEYLLKKGDIVVAMTDLTQNAPILGSSAIIPDNGRFLHNQRLGKIINLKSDKVHPEFVFYLFNSPSVRAQIKGSATGATVRHTAPSRIYAVSAPIPPLPAQKRIAEILSAYDELIENNQRRIKILESMARALYREWFVNFRFPGHENVPRVASALGEIPKGWEVKPFSALADYVNGFAFKPEDWGSEGIPIIKIKELKAGVTTETPRNSGEGIPKKLHISNGDVLFSWSAHLDTYLWAGGDGLLNQHLFNVVPKGDFSRTYCLHALQEEMPRFRALSLGATMQHIKRSALDQVLLAVPQINLRQIFEVNIAPIHTQLITLNQKMQNLRRTRDLLLPRLLSGQITVEAA